MKNFTVAASLFTALVCSLLLIKKNHEAAAVRDHAAVLEDERTANATREAEIEKRSKRLQNQLRQSLSQAEASAVETDQLKRALANLQAQDGKDQKPVSLFRDPEMKEALLAEVREGVEKNIRTLFKHGLAHDLHLNDEQTASLQTLLTQRMTLLNEGLFVPMATGELTDEQMAATGKATKQAYDENTAQLHALLGEEGYAQYDKFEKTEPDRDNLQRFGQESSHAGQPLSPEQETRLFAAMSEERLKLDPDFALGDLSKWDFENWYNNVSDDKIAAAGAELGRLDQRILERSQTILSPDQVALLKDLLKRRALQAALVVNSTKAMMGKRH